MKKLSVAIATYNEQENIARCLESVKWADEIIVCDEGSSDKTVEIVKKYTSKVLTNTHTDRPTFHQTKQKAIAKCTGEWILSIDADEEISPQLKEEIQKTISDTSATSQFNGYRFPRKSQIFGHWMAHTGWYPDYQVKLFKNGQGGYEAKSIHEQIAVTGEIGTFASDLWHYHYKSVEQFIGRLNRYTTDDAQFLIAKGQKVVWTDAIKFPADELFKRFFFWQGYLDGLHGLVLSLLQALNRLVVFAKMWESQSFFEHSDPNFVLQVENQVKILAHDYRHYLAMYTKNPAKKLALRLRNKLNV